MIFQISFIISKKQRQIYVISSVNRRLRIIVTTERQLLVYQVAGQVN